MNVNSYDAVYDYPKELYREPSKIRRDIRDISERIERTNEQLNIRALLIDLLASERSDRPEQLIPELEEALAEAREALYKLNGLKEELVILEDELGDARCLIKGRGKS